MSKHGNKAKCFRIGQKSGKTGQFKQNKQTFYFYLAEFARLYLRDFFFLSFHFTGQLEKQPSDFSPGIP